MHIPQQCLKNITTLNFGLIVIGKNINCPKPYGIEVETTNPYKLPCNGTQKLNHDIVLLNFNVDAYITAFR